MLAVAKIDATNRNAVIGVATEAVTAETITLEDDSKIIDFTPSDDVIAPGSYLVIVTGGLAPAVNLNSLTLLTTWEIGDKIAVSPSGGLGLLSGQADAIAVGKVAGPIDKANGTIPLFIDID